MRGTGLIMRDPYQTLGVAKTASASEIKSAFRKLAKKYHPDQSKEPRAKDRFAEIGSAYEILGDEAKRGAFDRGEIDAEGKPRAPSFEGFAPGGRGRSGGSAGFQDFNFNFGGGDFSAGRRSSGIDADILSELFGAGAGGRSRGPARGDDLALTATIALELAANGGSARVLMPNGKTLDVAIPAGVEEGQQIRLRGQGQPAARGQNAGDALVTIRYANHPDFKVEGRNLRLDLPITLYEAVLGGKVRVPTLGGAVEMAIAPGSNSGKVLRLRGKGLPATGDAGQGDLLATLRIALPAGADEELSALMRRWRDQRPYNPRGGAT